MSIWLLALMCGAAQVEAQTITPWAEGFEAPFRTSLNNTTIEHLSRTLVLSDDQIAAARNLLQQHELRFAAFRDEFLPLKKSLDQFVRRLPGGTVEQLDAILERETALAAVADRQAALDSQTLAELKQFLTEQQLEQWPMFMHRFNVERWRARPTMYAEEHVDFILLLEEIQEHVAETAPPQELQQVLTQYAVRKNNLLSDFARLDTAYARTFDRSMNWGRDNERYWLEGSKPGESTPETRWVKQRMSLHRQLRSLNREFFEPIKQLLPSSARSEFQHLYSSNVLKRAGVQTDDFIAEQFANRALEIETLSDEQRKDIRALLDLYLSDCQTKNNAIVKAHDELSDALMKTDSNRKAAEETLQRAIDSRSALESRLIETVKQLLNESQLTELAKDL